MSIGSPRYLFDTRSELASSFRRDGFLVLPSAADQGLLDRIRSVLEEMAYLPAEERPEVSGFSFDTGRYQDAWRTFPEIAELAVAPQIISALEHLYGAQPHPFQTLNFTVGTQQRAHSDHIHFSSRPLGFMCGVWVAIEDVTAENGPLFYYPGSHNLPYVSYAELGIDPSQLESEPHAYAQYESAIEKFAEGHGLTRQIFTANKGDVLIWAANLIHGGSPVTKLGSTRWSQVTHYLFDDCVHYTPRLSNELQGELFVRSPIDISTTAPIRSAFKRIDITTETLEGSSVVSDGDQSARLADENERLRGNVQRLEQELSALRATKLFRYTRRARGLYSRIRRTLLVGK